MAEPVGVLGEIAAAKRDEVARAVRRRVARRAAGAGSRPRAAWRQRLPGRARRFILEMKKASPSAGAIRDADAGAIARGYAGVADAISVLTDGPYFGGSLDDLAAARAEFDGPILAKDFFVDPRQVVGGAACRRRRGAGDAVGARRRAARGA